MGEFGSQLQQERERRGIGLDAITEATKISNRHLQALEHERFEQLPGGVFNKGIVRSYARVVGIDEEEWVGRFMAAYQGSGQLKDDDARWIAFSENPGNPVEADRADRRLRWTGVAVLLAVLAALGWFVWHYIGQKAAAQAPAAISIPSRLPDFGSSSFHTFDSSSFQDFDSANFQASTLPTASPS
jgi:cytoskeleton protein RodZ